MTELVNVGDELRKLQRPFDQVNQFGLSWQQECLFARQQIDRSEYNVTAARNNLKALQSAILNVAAVGISLNPAQAHAYLVPRAPKSGHPPVICLDISYRGLVKLATDSGAITWAKAVLVYEGDGFVWKGPATMPEHHADVFDPNRMDASDPLKNLRGGYCVAKLPDGSVLVEVMTAGEIQEVRATSKAQDGPWKGRWAGEMAKKTLVKRASKSWPQVSGRERFDQAVQILNEHEGIESAEPVEHEKIDQFLNLVAANHPLDFLNFTQELTFEEKTAAFNAAPKGEKTKLKNAARDLENRAWQVIDDYVAQILEGIDQEDQDAVTELLDELTEIERNLVNGRLTDLQHRALSQLVGVGK